ncbi:MAG: hypothetical protein Q7R39_13985, partial [Dehalococcoidia bacterium]|nr:hypothetical protein [Dehalococcoidia bacterium]
AAGFMPAPRALADARGRRLVSMPQASVWGGHKPQAEAWGIVFSCVVVSQRNYAMDDLRVKDAIRVQGAQSMWRYDALSTVL